MLQQLYARFLQVFADQNEPQNLSDVLERAASNYPEREGLVCAAKRLTFRQLYLQSSRLAQGLVALNIRQGDWVALMLPNCPEFVISFLAIAQIGAVVVPIDIYYRQPEVEGLFQTGPITALITAPKFLPTVETAVNRSPGFKQVILTEAFYQDEGTTTAYPILEQLINPIEITTTLTEDKHAAPQWAKPKINLSADLLYLYTSGTTGTPKGIMLSQAKVLAIGRAWRQHYPLSGDDKCYTLAPLFRSPALLSVLVAGLYYGIGMIIPPSFRPQQVWSDIISERVSFFHACPFHFAVLAQIALPEGLTLPPLKSCYSSGNRLPPWVAQTFLERFKLHIDEGYGTSEVGGICRNGYPLSHVQLKLLDKQGQVITAPEQIGEIVVKTPQMVKAYHNLPQLSAQVFKDGWFLTGDLGKFDGQGKLQITCRKKTAFLIAGKQVYADEVEQVLRQHPRVAEVRVVRHNAQSDQVSLKAMVVLKESCSAQALLEFCGRSLTIHKIPQSIEIREELPRSWKAVLAGLEQAYPKWGDT